MGKQGPCYHCGVASTPLWRNGPPEKPILCNACGSRWRTKGTLANYTPLHSRAEADDYEDQRLSKVKTTSHKIGDEKLKKRKPIYENSIGNRFASDSNQGFMKSADEDARNSSSSGSAGSNSESFLPFSSTDASDLTGPAQSAVWETQFPSKKRTCITRTKSSPVEKLLKDLHAILHEQESSCLSGSPEEDLLFGSDVPMVSVEIGHGSVLIKHPSSFVQEEDSEASSLSFENRPCAVSESCSLSASFSGSNGFNGGNVCKNRSSNLTKFTSDMTRQEVAKRDQFNHDRMQHFLTNNSPLCSLDLNDVINFEVLMRHFTSEEQQQLLKYLPPNDTSKLPGSLENMFDSPCFKENLIYFQQFLSAGVFSSSYSGDKLEDFKALKMLALSNLTKSKWLELYIKLKDSKSLTHTQEIEIESGGKLGSSKDLRSTKRPLQEQNPNMPGNETTECPKRGSFFTPGSLFHVPTSECCMKMDSCHEEFSDQDLLLDVPSNGSFPEAELLLPPLSARSHQTTTSSNSVDSSTMVHH